MLDAFKDLGFHYATQAGITISKNDVDRAAVQARRSSPSTRSGCSEIQDQYDEGLITQEERHQAVTDQWNEATDEVAEAMIENIETTDQLNSDLHDGQLRAPAARSSRSASWRACAA